MRHSRFLPFLLIALLGAGCSGPVTDSMIHGSPVQTAATTAATSAPSMEQPSHRSLLAKILDPWGDFTDEITVPDDFPITIPFYAGATVTGAEVVEKDGRQSAVLSMWTKDDVETLNAWYHVYTEDEGWELISESTSQGFATQAWKKGDDRLVTSLTWIEAQQRTNISVVLVSQVPTP